MKLHHRLQGLLEAAPSIDSLVLHPARFRDLACSVPLQLMGGTPGGQPTFCGRELYRCTRLPEQHVLLRDHGDVVKRVDLGWSEVGAS